MAAQAESVIRNIIREITLECSARGETVSETLAAFMSVFPQTELGMFMALTAEDKHRQLLELTSIVAGIRLFNRDSGKGGEGIDDLPVILRDALKVTSENIEKVLLKSLEAAYQFTGVLCSLAESPHPPPPPSTVLIVKEALTNCRQHQAFIKTLMSDIFSSAEHLDKLEAEFQATMESLKATVQSKTAVPTAQVYPLFTLLYQNWSGYQDEVVLLSVLSSLLTQLDQFTHISLDLTREETVAALLGLAVCPTDEERTKAAESNGQVVPGEHSSAEFLFSETTRDFDKLPLQFKGYCGYTLAVHDGFLLPANPSLGLLHYRGKYYAFSTTDAALAFSNNPEKFISAAVDCSRRSPELITLLDMHAHFSLARSGPGRPGRDGTVLHRPVTKCDAGTQTETHFVESNIVKSYEWNEWELRRKAVKLANLRQKVTHSAQTELSHYKRDNDTQVYLPRESETQTKRDAGTSVPRPAVYLAGLRGQGNEPTSVDLTLPVDTHNSITT